MVENIVGEKEKMLFPVFSPFPTMFSKDVIRTELILSQQALILRIYSTSLLKTLLKKGEIARNEQFLLFPQCFLPI